MSRPNLLLIFSDQQHFEAMGSVDSRFSTPALDRLASESVVFESAFCTTPQCSPSRSSMMTGLYPTKTGVMGNINAAGGEPLRMPTLAPDLKRAGYETGYFGKWHLGEELIARSGWDAFGTTDGGHDDPQVTEDALAFLGQEREGPFALVLSYNNPHDVYHFTPEMTAFDQLPPSWHRQDFTTVPEVQEQFMTDDQGRVIHGKPEEVWAGYRVHYAEVVERYDREVGRVMDALEASGKLEETLVVVASDHGDMDGQHRLIYKGPFMYEHMVRVPLMARVPKSMPASMNRRPDFDAVLVDLVPTLLEAAGAPARETDGVSLLPLLTGEGEAPRREFVVGQYYSKQKWVNPIRMIRTRRYKYTCYRPEGEELYDLQEDPHEVVNLATSTDYLDVKDELRNQLEKWMRGNDDPFETQVATDRAGRSRA